MMCDAVNVVPDNLCPAPTVTGFGENDCAPVMATTLIVMTPESLGGIGPSGLCQ
jgi:hypothetical protein